MRRLNEVANRAVVLLLAGLMAACGSGGMITTARNDSGTMVSFVMVAPQRSTDLLFRDDRIIIQFKFDPGAIRFQIQNISPRNAELEWDRTTLGIRQKYYPIRTSRTYYSDSLVGINRAVLPPLGHLVEFVLPAGNVIKEGGSWRELDLDQTYDHASGMQVVVDSAGSDMPVDLIVPIRFGGQERIYHFSFVPEPGLRSEALDVVRRRPPPPRTTQVVRLQDQLFTGVIVAGVIGVTALILSATRTSPLD